MNYQEAVQKALEEDRKVRADDPRLLTSVIVTHRDGMLLQHNAFVELWDDQWVVVFGEHMKPQVFECDEVRYYAQFTRTWPPRQDEEE